MTAVAAIDIGSNSVRLLVTKPNGEEAHREMHVTRLAEGVDKTGRLAEAALERTLTVIERYGRTMRALGATRLRVTATSAARDADNRAELFERIERAAGATPELLSGQREAALAFSGATADRKAADGPFATVDIGGGSTELAFGGSRCEQSVSLDMGCVRITERFLHDDPPTRDQLARARAHARSLLAGASVRVPVREARVFLGLAGTVTSLAAMAAGLRTYDPERTHGFCLKRDRVESLHDELAALTAQKREAQLLEPKRAGVIVGGSCVLVEVLRFFDQPEIVVSERDILDGLAASLR